MIITVPHPEVYRYMKRAPNLIPGHTQKGCVHIAPRIPVSEKAPSLGENKDTVARNVVSESALACTQTRIKDIPMLINAQGEVNVITEQKKLLEELVPSANWLAVGWMDVTVTSED